MNVFKLWCKIWWVMVYRPKSVWLFVNNVIGQHLLVLFLYVDSSLSWKQLDKCVKYDYCQIYSLLS